MIRHEIVPEDWRLDCLLSKLEIRYAVLRLKARKAISIDNIPGAV